MKPQTASPTRVSNRSASPIDTLAHTDWILFLSRAGNLISRPVIEVAHGIRSGALPWPECLLTGMLAGALILTHLDQRLLSLVHWDALYPTHPLFYWSYRCIALTVGFWIWGLRETYLRNQLITRLTTVFMESSLRSVLGNLPKFIFDRPVDDFTRKMRLARSGIAKGQFDKSKPALESALQVYIDEIRENRENGTIDLLYAHCPMPVLTQIENIRQIPPLHFVVGKTRAKQITVSFRDVPHLMVAGQTGGGKSTFLRELITTLYINNPKFEFTLIDLKGGMEFQTFENLSRAHVIPDVERAILALTTAEDTLKKRMALLKEHGCKDIDAYLAKVEQSRAVGSPPELGAAAPVSLSRHIIVVDEAAEMFLAGSHARTSEIQRAREVLSQIARQGRSVGVHLVIATQRPDSRALDPQVKANLTGVLCFQMQNDASSITVLGVGRATEIPHIPGRAIWKAGADMIEVQVPYLSIEEANDILKDERLNSETQVKTLVEVAVTAPTPIHEDTEADGRSE